MARGRVMWEDLREMAYNQPGGCEDDLFGFDYFDGWHLEIENWHFAGFGFEKRDVKDFAIEFSCSCDVDLSEALSLNEILGPDMSAGDVEPVGLDTGVLYT